MENARFGKLESAVLLLFCITLALWVADKLISGNITSALLTISILALLAASLILFISVLRALVQSRRSTKQGKKTPKKKKRKR